MSEPENAPPGPDLSKGVASEDIADGTMLVGHVGEAAVLVARVSGRLSAIGAECTHYHGPLGEGLLVGETVRCPWHHARFCLRTGEAIGAPAFDPVDCWRIDERGGQVFVHEKAEAPTTGGMTRRPAAPRRIVVVGGGAAGFATAEMLRREGYDGDLTLLSADADPPYDRPNCSKDYLAGKAPREWMPLRDAAFYDRRHITLRTGAEVGDLDLRDRGVVLKAGGRLPFDALVLATGAEPARLATPGFDQANVHVLRSLRDCEAIILAAETGRRVAIVGASFIGLEVAAALVERGLVVHVIAPETTPLAKILGEDLGVFVRSVHEDKGVIFHLGRSVARFAGGSVILDDGTSAPADFVVVGVGVKPRTELAAAAGLAVDRGVVVDARFETTAPGVFAVGDIARYPDPRTGELIRVEHWVAAQRQGQHAARVLLGMEGDYREAPFFWSAHYDATINYVGHAERFATADLDGAIADRSATVRLRDQDRLLAAATLGRDLDALRIEVGLEGGVSPTFTTD
jgi:NADPH-dependent 2,4-dienoyl-CoA reductase/sulfur reductase-like enzyme/nitrite reductase/ring-hydroxylating ferredoxin subunit